MKKIAVLLIALFALSTAINAQKCYDKLKVGSSWEVTMYNRKGKIVGKTVSKIINIKNTDTETIYTIEGQSYNKKGKLNKKGTTRIEGKCKSGKYYMDVQNFAKSMNSEFDKNKETENISIDFEMSKAEVPKVDTKVGTTLKDAYFKIISTFKNSIIPSTEMSFNIQNRIVKSIEDKETPVGTFKCQKVASDIMVKVSFIKQRFKAIEWYTDGFFVVYSEFYNKKGKLMSYNVLTKLDI